MEPGFHPDLVDMVVPVPDAASVAAMRRLRADTGLESGPSTGANLWGAFELIAVMRRDGLRGCVATVLADGAAHHRNTYWDDAWVRGRGLDPGPYQDAVEAFLSGGDWRPPAGP
jgi:cysteine synthase A